jgi:hypothetical protein
MKYDAMVWLRSDEDADVELASPWSDLSSY